MTDHEWALAQERAAAEAARTLLARVLDLAGYRLEQTPALQAIHDEARTFLKAEEARARLRGRPAASFAALCGPCEGVGLVRTPEGGRMTCSHCAGSGRVR